MQKRQRTYTHESTKQSSMSADIFDKQMKKHQDSKTVRILNFIYSFMIGVVSGFLSKRYLKHPQILGVIMALGTYLFCRKMIATETQQITK